MKVFLNTQRVIAVLAIALSSLSLNAKEQRVFVKMKNSGILNSLAQTQVMALRNKTTSLSSLEYLKQKQLQLVFPQVHLQLEDNLRNLNAMVAIVNSEADIESLRHNPNVDYVDVEVFHPAPKPSRGFLFSPLAEGVKLAEKSQTPWGILAVKAIEAWKLGGMGEKSRVLVLDTGIDKNHPSLKQNFEEGRNFVSEDEVENPSNTGDYVDLVGHGTHVSGTIAGVMDPSGFSGVAPKAKILMGRVCSPKGCSNIAIAQGLNWGIEKKVDVISMSLGGPWSTPSERDAIAKAYEAGITMVAATGNDGTSHVSFPAALREVIAVGAVDSNGQRAPFSQYGPSLAIMAPGVAVVSSVPVGTGRVSKVQMNINGSGLTEVQSTAFQGARSINTPLENELVYAGLGRPEDFAKVDVAGKFALVQRGEIEFGKKAMNAINARAAGIIIFNNSPGSVNGTLTQDGSIMPIPAFGIEQTTGEIAQKALAAGQVVRGRVAVEVTNYAPFDGTSMATTHIAGVVALMKNTNKGLSPAQVKDILQKTAMKVELNPSNQYGAGIVNAESAVKESLVTPAELLEEVAPGNNLTFVPDTQRVQ